MSLKIKTKLRYGIGLLFAMIVLLGGLSVKNISDMSADTRNILADNYNSLLYSRRMLDALERIDSDPSAQADFEKNLGLQKKNITGKVFVTFVINKNGEPVNFRIAKSVDPLLDREAIRVLQLMPNWKPGTQRGNPVSVEYTVPINFQLQ